MRRKTRLRRAFCSRALFLIRSHNPNSDFFRCHPGLHQLSVNAGFWADLVHPVSPEINPMAKGETHQNGSVLRRTLIGLKQNISRAPHVAASSRKPQEGDARRKRLAGMRSPPRVGLALASSAQKFRSRQRGSEARIH